MRTARGMLAVTACAVLLAGCAPNEPEPPSVEGLEITVVQSRSDVADRHAQVRVRNDTGATVEIGAVEVVDARFAAPAERTDPERITSVRPGATVDIRVALPAVDCASSDGEPRVRLELAASGPLVETPAADPLDVIAPLHERECRAERLADSADVSFASFQPSAHPAPAVLGLEIVPTGRARAVIVGIQPTNLLRFDGTRASGDTLPLDVVVGTGPVLVPLPLVPSRCDPHAVQEDKRGTVFTLEVQLDGEPGEVELAAPADLRARLLTWVSRWCGG